MWLVPINAIKPVDGRRTHFCKGAYGDLERISKMEPDQILLEARKSGLI